MLTFFGTIQDRCVDLYLRICPNPPGVGLFGDLRAGELRADDLRSAGAGDRASQILALLALGLPFAAVVPLLTWILPNSARVIVLAWVLASLFFLAAVDMRAKQRLDAARDAGNS